MTASNYFGTHFRITTWGESHGEAVGVIIDGCPSNVELSEIDINEKMKLRFPGRDKNLASQRNEKDTARILSGVFEGKTTGAPIHIYIKNSDVDSSKYEKVRSIYRPGHANFTYHKKYGHFDHRGGGRASGRETACRVAAGAVADKILEKHSIQIFSYIRTCGTFISEENFSKEKGLTPLFCLSEEDEGRVTQEVQRARLEKDSVGGTIETKILGAPIGLGDPVYGKLSAKLAGGMMSIPGAKAFEIGEGVSSAFFKGSEYTDPFYFENGRVRTRTNHCGGMLGGISTGEEIVIRTTFKPTATIGKPIESVTMDGKETQFFMEGIDRHDPCIALRATPVCSAMASLVLVDLLQANKL